MFALLTSLQWVSFFCWTLHPLHISVTEIEYNEKEEALQITSRIFIDDLESSIRARRKEPELELMNPPSGLTTDQLVNEYLVDHFKIKIDGRPQKIHYLGHEVEDAAIICYIEVENIRKIKMLEIHNDVIMETHDDQSNLVHVTYKSPVKSVRLLRSKPSDIFRFDGK